MKSATTNPSRLSNYLLAIRPKTLPASVSPVLLGTAAVPLDSINWLLALCALGCALFLQIAVNLANDFFDARSGVDSEQRLGPTRVTHAGLVSETQVIVALSLSLIIASICGLVLVAYSGPLLLAIGLLAILATFAYSGGPFPLASHGLGEITVLVFFGWVAVMGSYYIQTHHFSWHVFALANALGMILAAIMLINNIRDIPSDAAAGKKTLAVYLGATRSRKLFAILMILLPIFHCLAFLFSATPNIPGILLPLIITIPLSIQVCRELSQSEGRMLNSLLAKTAQLSLIYGAATSASLVFI
ncbi:1,4-dihydroxy-2-naphthoate prenyltransferase [Alteromonadaceae bacterium Bs31]|nr:1,4-dihydroxy-2-naphthoate prenyltransferase [Alteromonadaceae bacterium Bs31]